MRKYKNLEDAELINLLKNGDHAAYGEIYDRYYYRMYIFAYKKLRDEELSKDFIQELFINLWDKKEKLTENGKLSSYLYITVRSRMFDFFAHQKVQHKYILYLRNRPITISEKTDFLVREKQLQAYIEDEIDKLPKKMKHIFELSRKEFLSHREIAEKLNTSEHNISKQISNALKIFRSKFTL